MGKPKPNKAKMGRPRADIDLELAERLGAIWCSLAECSAMLDVPVGTLSTRADFSEAYKRGWEKGKMSLRRDMRKQAKTSATMAIWLSKQHLAMSDSPVPEDDEFELIDNWSGGEIESQPTKV